MLPWIHLSPALRFRRCGSLLERVRMAKPSELEFTRIVSSRHQIESLAFSLNSDLLAACFSDGSVRLYNVELTEDQKGGASHPCAAQIAHFKEHTSNVWCVCFSSDGTYLSSCSSDTYTIVYSLSTLSVHKILTHHQDTVWCCKFSKLSGSDLLATSSSDCTVKLVSAITGLVHHTLTDLEVECLDFSEDGKMLCTASKDGRVCLWTNISLSPICHLVFDGTQSVRLCRLLLSDNINYLLFSSTTDHSVFIFDLTQLLTDKNNEKLMLVEHKEDDINSGGAISSYMLKFLKYHLKGHCNIVWACCIAKSIADIDLLITCSGDRTAR